MNRTTEQRNTEAAKTLDMLDKMPKVEVNHLFRARLLQRIDAMESGKTAGATLFGGAFSPKLAFMTVLLILNVASAVLLFLHEAPRQNTGAATPVAENVSADYGGPALAYYDDQPSSGR
jgi:hypothetical protein